MQYSQGSQQEGATDGDAVDVGGASIGIGDAVRIIQRGKYMDNTGSRVLAVSLKSTLLCCNSA